MPSPVFFSIGYEVLANDNLRNCRLNRRSDEIIYPALQLKTLL